MQSESFQQRTPIKRINNQQQQTDYKKLTKSREEVVPFSFRANHIEGAIHSYLSKVEDQQKANDKSRYQYTHKKISIVSNIPFQKTQKKKYLKLMSSLFESIKKQNKEQKDQDGLSNIAHQQYEDTLGIKQQQVKSSLSYFNEELLLLNQYKNINQIEKEEKIVILSQINSSNKIKLESQNIENSVEKDKKQNVSQKIKKKIALCHIKKQQSNQKNDLSIKQIYRYCIGCQYPIIQGNIKIHQQSCKQYKKVYEMSHEEIAQFLKKMINQLGKKIEHIKQTLTEEDLKNLKIYTDALIKQTDLISITGQKSQIYNFKFQSLKEVNKKWILFAEEICKLNWFIKLRQMVKEKYQK